MKITIPKKYIKKFEDNIVFVSPFRGRKILLTNKEEKEKLINKIDDLKKCLTRDEFENFLRILKSGFYKTKIKNGIIDMPTCADKWVDKGKMYFKEIDSYLFIQTKNN